jgi:hypothetical protein
MNKEIKDIKRMIKISKQQLKCKREKMEEAMVKRKSSGLDGEDSSSGDNSD